jgi:hypothetical protein
MSLDMTPERLNADAVLFMNDINQTMSSEGVALTERAIAALRVAAWLATPGNNVIGFTSEGTSIYRACADRAVVGTGPAALAAVLDAVGVKP